MSQELKPLRAHIISGDPCWCGATRTDRDDGSIVMMHTEKSYPPEVLALVRAARAVLKDPGYDPLLILDSALRAFEGVE